MVFRLVLTVAVFAVRVWLLATLARSGEMSVALLGGGLAGLFMAFKFSQGVWGWVPGVGEVRALFVTWLEADGVPPPDARRIARELTRETARSSVKQPKEWFGRRLLARADAGAPEAVAHLRALRMDGVTDNDILSWYARAPLERDALRVYGNHRRMVDWIDALKLGLSQEEAAARMHSVHLTFGDCSQSRAGVRFLPWELYERATAVLDDLIAEFGSDLSATSLSVGGLNELVRRRLIAPNEPLDR